MIRRSPRPTRTDTLFHYTTRFRSRVLSSRWVSRSIAPTSGGAQGDRRADPSLLAVAINQDAAPRSQHDTGKLQAHLRGRLHAPRNNAAATAAVQIARRQSIRSRMPLPGEDRRSVVSGKSVSVRVDLGGRRHIKKKNI